MKKLCFFFLITGMIVIIYLFVKEQFKGIVLTSGENMLLSITYLVVGVALFILYKKRNVQGRE
jgi:hypothetical protein